MTKKIKYKDTLDICTMQCPGKDNGSHKRLGAPCFVNFSEQPAYTGKRSDVKLSNK